jgi:GGDEF domain-containing protein
MSVVEGFLGRVLTDPATGLPNLPYFRLIREWEERRARRREYTVRVVRINVTGGDERIRRSLSWRFCRELRGSDLIASEGLGHFRVLLTTPDAEQAELIRDRIEALTAEINARGGTGEPLQLQVEVEESRAVEPRGPCEPCDPEALENSGEGFPVDDPAQ